MWIRCRRAEKAELKAEPAASASEATALRRYTNQIIIMK